MRFGSLFLFIKSDNFLLFTAARVASIAMLPVTETLAAILIGGSTLITLFLLISTSNDGALDPTTIKSGLNFSSRNFILFVMILVN